MALDFTAMTCRMTVAGDTGSLTLFLGFRARVLRAFRAKIASGSLGSSLVAYERQRRVG